MPCAELLGEALILPPLRGFLPAPRPPHLHVTEASGQRSVLGVSPKELNTGTQTSSWTHDHSSSTIPTAQRWRQLSIRQQTNAVWQTCTVAYYSAVKRNVVLTHAAKWMNRENIILSERSQTQKAMLHDSIYVQYPKQVCQERQHTDWWLPKFGGESGGETAC